MIYFTQVEYAKGTTRWRVYFTRSSWRSASHNKKLWLRLDLNLFTQKLELDWNVIATAWKSRLNSIKILEASRNIASISTSFSLSLLIISR